MHELTKTLVNVPSLNYLIHLEELGSLFSEGGDFFFPAFFLSFLPFFFLILYFNIYWILNLLFNLIFIKLLQFQINIPVHVIN